MPAFQSQMCNSRFMRNIRLVFLFGMEVELEKKTEDKMKQGSYVNN